MPITKISVKEVKWAKMMKGMNESAWIPSFLLALTLFPYYLYRVFDGYYKESLSLLQFKSGKEVLLPGES